METTHRPATPAHSRLGRLVTAALAVGTVSASALTVSAAGAASGNQVTLSELTVAKMGKVLFENGKPLYVISRAGSPCDAACLKIWPALTLPAGVTSATAGKGVQASKLGTAAGPNGLSQVTYNGQPVYFFFHDVRGKAKVKGNIKDQWGTWTAVVLAKAPGSSSGNSSSGGSNAGSGGASF